MIDTKNYRDAGQPRPQRAYQDFYTSESVRYERRRYHSAYGLLFRELHYRQLATLLYDATPETRIVEIACGTGHASRLLENLGLEACSFDLTQAMIDRARSSVGPIQRQRFARADAFRLPLADCSQQILISTRFMHLFDSETQARLLTEFLRVLAPGGRLVLDFDNRAARRIFAPAIVPYNLLRYRRWQPDTHYNSFEEVESMLERAGAKLELLAGVGGIHLAALAKISPHLALRLGEQHRNPPWALLAEQFVISARKP